MARNSCDKSLRQQADCRRWRRASDEEKFGRMDELLDNGGWRVQGQRKGG